MDPITTDTLIMFVAAVVLPLILLGLLADRLGADSRDLEGNHSGSTPWTW